MTPPNQRNKAIRAARDFFHKRQLIEVMTPKAVLSPALEPYMDAVWLYSQHNTKQLFLATSPEMALKKRFQSEMKVNPTAQGIYEIAPVFRDDRKSKNHNIEFTMVEWYEKDSSLNKILSEAAALIQNLGEYLTHKKIFPAYEIFTVEELFRQAGHSFTLTSEEAVVEKYQSLYATLPQHFNAMDKATICFNLLFDA
ncbi:MAG TPA: hypothetical protein PLY93_14660, partial [Turneriella sp.]|nr:hypothetical protein [Turneriella sp.]